MKSELPYWIQIVQALGPVAVALAIGCVAAGVAFLQWRTAKDKLRLDLFERRLEVYLLIERFRVRVAQKGGTDPDDIGLLHQAKARSEFLFGLDVVNYIEGMKNNWISLITAIDGMERNDETRSVHISEKYRILNDIVGSERLVVELFSKYMSFENYKS